MDLINQPLTATGKEPMDTSELLRRYAAGERDFKNVSLSGAQLGRACLSGIDLSRAELIGANLAHATLRAANLSEANLNGANLSQANLFVAHFRLVDFLYILQLSRTFAGGLIFRFKSSQVPQNLSL